MSDQGVKYGYEFYVDGIKKASIADIASDDIESIEVDKQDSDHPKVYVTLKKWFCSIFLNEWCLTAWGNGTSPLP